MSHPIKKFIRSGTYKRRFKKNQSFYKNYFQNVLGFQNKNEGNILNI